jgi:hypothetical protein
MNGEFVYTIKNALLLILAVVLVPKAFAEIRVGDTAPCYKLNFISDVGYKNEVREGSTCESGTVDSPKPLVLAFSTIQCELTEGFLSVFENFSTQYGWNGNQAIFRLINADSEKETLDYFGSRHKTNSITYEIATDLDHINNSWNLFGVEGVPMVLVIGVDRKVKYIHYGSYDSYRELAELESAILELTYLTFK